MTETRRSVTHRRVLRWGVIVAAAGGLLASGQAAHADSVRANLAGLSDVSEVGVRTASASSVEWVDGGDDSPCLNDDTGRALTALPADKFCTTINGCYQDNDGKWVLPSRKTGIWQGDPSEVKYADELGPAPTTPPTTPKPTTPAPTTPPRSGAGSGTGTGSGTSNGPSGSGPSAGPTDDGAVGATTDPAAQDGPTAPDGSEPTAPAAPTLTGSGSDLEVTWTPPADAASKGVTGYVVEVSGLEPVQVDAVTTAHSFPAVPDGTYIAVVRAVNASGSSPSSAPSAPVTVGVPVAQVVGTVEVQGSLTPGGTVTIVGTGYAHNISNLQVELHSTPVVLGVVATDATGGFSTSVALPDTVEPGDHTIVVVHDGVEVSRTPVQLTSAAGSGAGVTATEAGPAESSSGPAPSLVGVVLILVIMVGLAGALIWQRRRSSGSGQATDAPGPVDPEQVPPADHGRTQQLQEVK